MGYDFSLDVFKKQAIEEGHSDKFIELTTEYIKRLKGSDLPVIFSLNHLALILDIPYIEILGMAKHSETYYRTYKIKKKRGGFRQIMSPKASLKFVQRWINENILSKIPLDIACTGFRKNSSIKKNALLHKDKEAVISLDLYRFFETITQSRVYGVFKSIGYHRNLAVYLAQMTTSPPPYLFRETVLQDNFVPAGFLKQEIEDESILPQGAPTSPGLSNIVARKLDLRLRKLSEKFKVSYSRYADDITFSGQKHRLPSIKFVEQIVSDESFYLNRSKIRIAKRGQKQIVTGLTVTNGVHVPKAYKKDIWKHIYFSRKFGPIDHLNRINKLNLAGFKDWLLGRIHFVSSIELNEGKKMLNAYKEIEWLL